MKSLFSKRKKKNKLLLPCNCRNCGTELIAKYCHNCGQSVSAGNERTVGEILYNTVDTIFAWDNKILTTLKYLIFYPGKLTQEFFSGKVVQYVYPAKLFWFITILFFAVLNLGDKIGNSLQEDQEEVNVAVNAAVTADQESTTFAPPKEKTTIKEAATSAEEEADKAEEKKVRSIISKVTQGFVSYIPYVILLLVPFFAFLLYILFYKKKRYYASHIIFALHFHAFIFLFFTLLLLVSDFIPDSWDKAVTYITLLLPMIYLVVALFVAYRPGIPKLAWKIPFIMFFYGVTCIATLLLFIVLLVIRIAGIERLNDMF